MTDATDSPGQGPSAPPPKLVSAADFRAVDFDAAIPDPANVDVFSLCEVFFKQAEAAKAAGDIRASDVYRLLNGLCTFSLNVEDRSGPFRPLFQAGDQRAMTPDDCRGEQSAELLKILDDIRHAGLRARVADTVWTNHRRYGRGALVAIEAYAECVEGLLDGCLHHQREPRRAVALETLKLLQRAVQIARATTKDGVVPDQLAALLNRVLDLAERECELVTFRSASETAIGADIVDPVQIATRTEALIARAPETTNGHLLKSMWELAAEGHERAKQPDEGRRCRLEAAEELVRLADRRKASATVSAMFLMDAIRELRRIKGTRERRKVLEAQLRDLQEDSLDEMGVFSLPMDLREIVDVVRERFATIPLHEMLVQIAMFVDPPKIADLRAAALKSAQDSLLSSMFGETRLDSGGKVVSRNPGFEARKEPTEEWYRSRIARDDAIRREVLLRGQIEPARLIIAQTYPLSERHFHPIVELSAFVPPGYEHIFSLGLARLFQGDNASAVHLLLPQLENSIRYVLKQRGRDPSMIQADMIQEDRSLSALLADERPLLDDIFGPDLVFEIDMLFNDRAGPALRHEFAHGKLSDGHCYASNALYAIWVIYRLVIVGIGQEWSTHLVPYFESEVL